MSKKLIPVFLLVSILMASCGILVDKAEPTATVEPTAESAAAEPTAQPTQAPITDASNPCIPFSVLSYSLSSPYPNLPPITAEDYAVGPADAALTFIVYTDPQCPYCAQLDPILDQFQALYPDDVRVVTRLFPLTSIHDKAMAATQALFAAGLQNKFNELRKFLFERQRQDLSTDTSLTEADFWGSLAAADFENWLKERVPALGIDADQLLADMKSDTVVAKAQASLDSAMTIGISGTPTLMVNGYQWPENQRGIEIFSIYLRLIKNQANEFDSCPATVVDAGKKYTATIETTRGDIQVELYPDKAPVAVNSFVYLAEQGWYDNLPIIASSDFVLSGDPSDTGYGSAGYAFLDENSGLTFEQPGMLAVYSVWPGYGTNGSMFFMNKTALTDQGNRTIFGKVTAGLDVLDKFEIRDNIFNDVIDKVIKVTINEE
jgi:cyclophilin family peptidyl-prolyl cis-trans isomerase/protein-disulfide isomerase